MAYVSKEKKAKIAEALKAVMPAGWKYSLAVEHHSTIRLTISAAPVNILAALARSEYRDPTAITYADLNQYHLEREFADATMVAVFSKIRRALHTDNYDRSDIQTDYFDVGHYVDIRIGRYGKPFIYLPPAAA